MGGQEEVQPSSNITDSFGPGSAIQQQATPQVSSNTVCILYRAVLLIRTHFFRIRIHKLFFSDSDTDSDS
jgi:hypothetical protein